MATYRAESWTLNKDIAKRLSVFDTKVLRRKFWGIKVNENRKKRYNTELMQRFGDFHTLSFVRTSRLNWVGHVTRMESKRKIFYVFKDNRQGSQLRGRPKNRWWNCLQTDISKCKTTNWKVRSKNRADWEKSIKEAKVSIGL